MILWDLGRIPYTAGVQFGNGATVANGTAHLVQQVQLNSLQSPRKMSRSKEQIRDGTGPVSKLLPTSKVAVS
jgi:hypothetical protein